MDLPRDPDKTITFEMKKMHILVLVVSVLAIFFGAIIASMIHTESIFKITLTNFLLFIVLYIAGIILHECCHLLGFMMWGKASWNDLVYGINRELGVAYAGTKKMIQNHAMKKALLLPFWVTGLLPFIIGIWLNNGVLIVVSAFLIGGAAGDFSMYNQLRKVKNDAYIIDDLEKPQLYVFYEKPDGV
ncbi:hypothetical protein DCC39_12530 [Pueribacillus theae]|uniref:DUF3267 domain-containing protein n=1 Tax=Pueribacillus theae TaxID=2171751 RepID=A0A2U1JWT3_9BACI|nr:DUF3267 domain-containing protein [Pueribacillus theae]PWA09667.1 hypothetical protein DCC39_12530 [Pueribacillus theae]